MPDLTAERPGTGSLPMTRVLSRIRVAALWALGIIVATADAVAFAESYHGLKGWALAHRVPGGFWAGAWPLQVDAYIIAGEIVLLLSAIHGWHRRARVLGWAMSLSGLGGSIVWNAGHVGSGATPADHITAAVPPVAAMGGLVGALLVIKYVARMAMVPAVPTQPGMGRSRPPSGGSLAPGGGIVLAPATPAACAALLSSLTADLTAAVSGATGAVLALTRETSGRLDPETSGPDPRIVPGIEPGHPAHVGDPDTPAEDLKIPGQTSRDPDAPTSRYPGSDDAPDHDTDDHDANDIDAPDHDTDDIDHDTDDDPDHDPGGGGGRPGGAPVVIPALRGDAARLEALPSHAARVRAALEALGGVDAEPLQVTGWLAHRGVVIDSAYVRTAIKRARQKTRQVEKARQVEADAQAAPDVPRVRHLHHT